MGRTAGEGRRGQVESKAFCRGRGEIEGERREEGGSEWTVGGVYYQGLGGLGV